MGSMQTFLSIVSIVLSLTTVAVAWARYRGYRASLGAQRAMYEGQYAAIWQEAYDQGVQDERMAAEYNVGTYEEVAANRVNPYAVQDGAR